MIIRIILLCIMLLGNTGQQIPIENNQELLTITGKSNIIVFDNQELYNKWMNETTKEWDYNKDGSVNIKFSNQEKAE